MTIAAIAILWPILFFVPGWIVVRRVVPDLPAPGAVGVGIVASVYLSAHVVDIVARVVGFGQPAVLASLLLLIVATVGSQTAPPVAGATRTADPRRHPGHASRRCRGVARRRRDRPAHRADPVRERLARDRRRLVSGGWNWSDLLVHVAIGESIVHGNFPPEVPYFAGDPLSYHWFADFHGASPRPRRTSRSSPSSSRRARFAGVLALVVGRSPWD